jgi:hypothetical protein
LGQREFQRCARARLLRVVVEIRIAAIALHGRCGVVDEEQSIRAPTGVFKYGGKLVRFRGNGSGGGIGAVDKNPQIESAAGELEPWFCQREHQAQQRKHAERFV